MRNIRSLRSAILAGLALGAPTMTLHAADWLQFGYDAKHTSNNTAESGYSTPANSLVYSKALIGPDGLGMGGTAAAPADSTPLFVSGVTVGTSTKDLLFVTTLNGTLLALDAKDGSTVWAQRPAALNNANGVYKQGGTTGSPVVDAAKQYVYSYGLDGKIHKYTIGAGVETIDASWPEVSTVKPEEEKAGGGLAIASTGMGTFLYSVTDGYNGDGGDYQGHLTAINLISGAQKVFNSHCSNLTNHFDGSGITGSGCGRKLNGIWGRPGAVYDPGTDQVFITTGNGTYDGDSSSRQFSWGDSVLALNPDGSGSAAGFPIDAYTPTSAALLQGSDADLGDTSVALLPTPAGSTVAHVGLQGGKDGCVRLLNLGLLNGQHKPLNGTDKLPVKGGELQAFPLQGVADHCTDGGNVSEFKTQPVVWTNPADKSTWVFIAHNTGLVAYSLGLDGSSKPTLTFQWSTTNSGTTPVMANNTLYYATSNKFYAVNPITHATIWTGTSNRTIHWQSPIVVNSRAYIVDVADGTGAASTLWVYQLDGIFKNGLD